MSHELGGPVLVVHQDAGVRDVIAEALALEGIDAAGATHAEAPGVLEALGRERPALVLLDLDGETTGFRAFLARRHGQPVPVVGLSTAPSSLRAPGAWSAGAAALLPMPFLLDDLISVVSRFCRAN